VYDGTPWDTFTDLSTIQVCHLNIIMFCLKEKHLACQLEIITYWYSIQMFIC